MPRFKFHLYEDRVAVDDEGLELADIETARRRAIEGVRGIMAKEFRKGRLNLGHWIEVEDGNGEIVLCIPFRETIMIETKEQLKGYWQSR